MNKDNDILYFLNECPLLTRKQLGQLTGRNNSWLNESLRRMVAEKSIYFQSGRNRYEPNVYAAYNITKRTNFAHDVKISEIYTALKCTGKISEWYQPKQKLKEEVNQDVEFFWRIPKTPHGERIKYYAELETGKNSWWQIDKKFEYYNEMRKRQAFQVIFVLVNQDWKHLSDYIERVEKKQFVTPDPEQSWEWKRYLFTMLDDITTTPLEPIFQTAFDKGENGKRKLYPLSPDLVK